MFTLKTHPQGKVWVSIFMPPYISPSAELAIKGGTVVSLADQLDAVIAATSKFTSSVQDPKAAIIASYGVFNGTVSLYS